MKRTKLISVLLLACLLANTLLLAWSSALIDGEQEDYSTFNTAFNLQFGELKEGTLPCRDRNTYEFYEDYYKILLPSNGQIKIALRITTRSNNFIFKLYDANGEEIVYCNNGSVSSSADKDLYELNFRQRLPKGVCYINIFSWETSGEDIKYTLKVDFIDEPNGNFAVKPNDSIDNATPLVLNKPISGGLSRIYSMRGYYLSCDEDYFTFTIDKKQTVTFEYNFSKGAPNHELSLYQKDRWGDAEMLDSWSMGNRPYPASEKKDLEAGTYYLNVYGGTNANVTDDYTLTVKTATPADTSKTDSDDNKPSTDPEDTKLPDDDSKETVDDTKSPDDETENKTTPTLTPSNGTSEGASSWAVEQIDEAIAFGIIPDDLLEDYQSNITRAEFCRMVVRMLMAKCGTVGHEEDFISGFHINMDDEPFDDTSDRYIHIAYALKVVNGTGDGKFTPDGLITRQESARMLTNAAAVFEFTTYSEEPIAFKDKDTVAIWASVAVDFVSANGIMGGTGDNFFSPHDRYTREQAILTMLRLFKAYPREYYSI